VVVRAGKGMLEMVLQNILENAISFSPRGSTLTVSLKKARDTVELRVEDEGPGIASERIDYIFERYFSARPHQQDGAQQPHSGLGLWIVRRNVEALGGEVSATNRAGGGLAISVVLPRTRD
jgi:two-component system sensor histidine kinase ChvG